MSEEVVGRNEPCPCGSGKKYKRCCGVDAAPKLSKPADSPTMSDAMKESLPPGFDPSQMDPEWTKKLGTMMKRLPKSQLSRLQSLIQQSMSGRDVTQELMQLQSTLPPEFMSFLMSSPMAQAWQNAAPGAGEKPLSIEDAKKVVEEAAKKGQISADEAKLLLENAANAPAQDEGKFKRLWKSVTGSK